MGLFRNNYSFVPCEFIVFEGDFYTFFSGFLGRNSSIPGVATKYLSPFFRWLVLVMLRAAYLSHKYFFLHFSFFKKGLHREYKGILE